MKHFNKIKFILLVFIALATINTPLSIKAGWFGGATKQQSAVNIDSDLKGFLKVYDTQLKGKKDYKKYRNIFINAYELLISNYVYTLDNNKRKAILTLVKDKMLQKEKNILNNNQEVISKILTYTALNTLYSDLDPHTSWLNPKENSLLKSSIDGEYKGVGIVLGVEKNLKYIKAIGIIKDSPAEKAGVKEGDLIYKINNKVYNSKQLELVAQILRDKDNNWVELTVLRDNKPIILYIKRGKVNLNTVFYECIDQKYAYIKISTFNYNTTLELRKVFRRHDINSAKGIILDLRDNPGGLLYSALIVADMFLDKGLILSVKGREAKNDTIYYATNSISVKLNLPLVILVNNLTASAAEIVSAALQQNNRAIVMGQQSFGKGSVQSIFDLSDGSAAKITTQLFYTPNGDALQGIGVIPNILIHNEHKTPFSNIRESTYSNKLTVKQVIHSKKPALVIDDKICKPVGKYKDKEIGCVIDYFCGKIKLQ